MNSDNEKKMKSNSVAEVCTTNISSSFFLQNI